MHLRRRPTATGYWRPSLLGNARSAFDKAENRRIAAKTRGVRTDDLEGAVDHGERGVGRRSRVDRMDRHLHERLED